MVTSMNPLNRSLGQPSSPPLFNSGDAVRFLTEGDDLGLDTNQFFETHGQS